MTNADVVAEWHSASPRTWDAETIAWWEEHVWSPDIEWRAIEGAPDDVGPMNGVDRLKRYYGEWLELFEEIHIEAGECRDVGDKVVVALHVDARARSTGMPLELDYAIVYELDAVGRVRRGCEYASFDEALAKAAAVPHRDRPGVG
jgi:ketosteroid isomerase-like protein